MKSLFMCYSRLLIDNHITDQKKLFMSRFDPVDYAAKVRESGVESAMVYACDHNGNCYYPTRVGHMHANLCGRDLFGETVTELARVGIVPVAYYTVVYHNNAAITHPDWRLKSADGVFRDRRYHWCCPNHPDYQAFCRAQITEILDYDIAGLFIDMTFWPRICVCPCCREGFRRASGLELPEKLDWNDLRWVRFQRWREESIAAFARQLSDLVRGVAPEIAVTHQFSPVLHGWRLGQSSGIAAAADYASGDFYGGRLQQRFGVKVFSAYTSRPPFEFMTSRCVSLADHTTCKSDEELYLHAVTTLMNGGAYFFIDAINPDGTLYDAFYRRLGKIGAKLEPIRREIAGHRPRLRGEVGLYFSMASCIEPQLDGTPLAELTMPRNGNMDKNRNPLLDEALGCAELLNQLHLPYRVITDRTELDHDLKALILPDARYLSSEECRRIRRFVSEGGTLIATGWSSFSTPEGISDGNFQLAELFGVDASGETSGEVSYLQYGNEMLLAEGKAPLVVPRAGTLVSGRVALTDFPPDDPDHYASIHSNPPGPVSKAAGLTRHRFGRGEVIYLYGRLLAKRCWSQQEFGRALFREHLPEFVVSSRNLPPAVELTVLESTVDQALLLGMVNFQAELPNLPLFDLELTVKLPDGFLPARITRASDGREIRSLFQEGRLTLRLERFDNAELFTLQP